MQLADGSRVAGGAARRCRRTGDEVGVVGEMVFRVVDVVVLVFMVGEVNDDNDDEAEAIHAANPWGIKQEENIVIMRMGERISSPFSGSFSRSTKSGRNEVYEYE